MPLKNKVAIVTGAASGIGKEIALALAGAGANVAIADLNQAGAEAAATELRAGDHNVIAVAMDVADEAQVEAGIARVIQTLGRLDILVCNAGIQTIASIDQLEFAKWKQLLAVH